MTLINWLLKLKMHINTYFLNFCYGLKIRYENFYIFERLGRMRENMIFFLYFFVIFYRKPGILIHDLYFLQYKNTNQY